MTFPHLNDDVILDYVRARTVPNEAVAHLRSGCPECHDRLQAAFDDTLREVEAGNDKRDVPGWLDDLGERYVRRHFCPVSLIEALRREEEAAHRHLRHCPLCAQEIEELDAIARGAEDPDPSA